MALTFRKVAQLNEPGRYGDGRGLYLQVSPTGARSWCLRYQRGGRERMMGLGPVSDFSLDEARERARKARQLLADGIDPLDARKQERLQQETEAAVAAARNVTFKDAADRFFQFHSPKWTNRKHTEQFHSSLEAYAYPTLGKLPVAAIDVGLVVKAIEPIWQTKTSTANRVRNRIETVLDFAKVNGWRTGENPAAWTGNLKHLLPAPSLITKVQHLKALPFTEIHDFMTALASRQGMAARALEFAILTAARSGEVIGARWSEIDLRESTWTIPAERMKGGKAHKVPLSDRAVELLQALPCEADFIFFGIKQGQPLGHNELGKQLKRVRPGVTVHGFRSSFRDWAAERSTYPNHVVEMALAHSIGSAVERAYRRGDLFVQRTHLMADWAAFCARPPHDATVTPIRSGRSA